MALLTALSLSATGLVLAASAAPASATVPTYTLSIFAGDGTQGATAEGPATSSPLTGPNSAALDASGNVYFGEADGNRVDKISPAGALTHVAGVPGGGTSEGAASAYSLYRPNGEVVDSSGNVYIADSQNWRIVKVTPAGQLSFFAGTGSQFDALAEGPATDSGMNPMGLAIDSSDNIYVADWMNGTVEKITPAGQLSIVAGTGENGAPTAGPATSSKLNYPSAVAVDGSGNVFIGSGDRILKVTPAGQLSFFAEVASRVVGRNLRELPST